jgi:hypothetical protein
MSAMPSVLFDDSLPRLAQVLRRAFGESALQDGVVLRDATGRLSFVAAREATSEGERKQVTKALTEALGPYARPNRVLAFQNDPGSGQLLRDLAYLPVEMDGLFCRLIDRRIVGAGWLDSPKDEAKGPPRIVFASLKGGVGRSTALTVAAADLARRNYNVLVVDLDLEAPGLGHLLLDEERMPQFGAIDFLVENGIGGVPDGRIGDFVGQSALTTGAGGRVDVVPALGLQANKNPENVLPKLARAMIEDVTKKGEAISVSTQIETMIARLAARAEYDAILIDSRAGLAELAAPAILGLGATALLFGTAQQQTITGYRSLFAALKLLAQRDRVAGGKAEWRLMLKPVYAKASLDEAVAARHQDELYELFADNLYDAEVEGRPIDDDISFSVNDPNAPHWPLVIPFNQNFVDFDSIRNPSQLTMAFYEQTFRPFLNGLDAIMDAAVGGSGAAMRDPA